MKSLTPIEPLKPTVGLRWYQVKNIRGYEEGLATGGGPAVVSPPATTTENGVNPKFEADYHFTPDQMVYAIVAKGFSPGGIVPIVPAGEPGHCGLRGSAESGGSQYHHLRRPVLQSDSLWNYEFGTKTSWFDHRLTFDAAGFYINWKNIQQEILLSCGFQYTANAGAAVSKGGELEIRASPTEPLEFSLGSGIRTRRSPRRVPSLPAAGRLTDLSGARLDRERLCDVHAPLIGEWKLVGGADYSYIGTQL